MLVGFFRFAQAKIEDAGNSGPGWRSSPRWARDIQTHDEDLALNAFVVSQKKCQELALAIVQYLGCVTSTSLPCTESIQYDLWRRIGKANPVLDALLSTATTSC
jgi:hypothetical protein